MLQQDRLDARVMLQNSKEFRAAVPTISDNADPLAQLVEYSSL
jgi:hypothetical protein